MDKKSRISTIITLLIFVLAILVLVFLTKNKGDFGAAISDIVGIFK